MKVLWIGPYMDRTGWSKASIDWILALDSVGVEVVPRPIRYNDNKIIDWPERIVELEQNTEKGTDIVVQHALPHSFSYDGNFKNIGVWFTETDSFKSSHWVEHINTLDEGWVCNYQMKKAGEVSGVEIPLKLVPLATDTAKFDKSYETPDLPIPSDAYVFYFIGEFIERKNLKALITAFHLEFSPEENVELVIKSNKFGHTPDETAQLIRDLCLSIKRDLKLYKSSNYYKEELVVTDDLSEEELYGLHLVGDCIVSPSRGESWGIPIFDAIGFGKQAISTNYGGPTDFLSESHETWESPGILVPYELQNCHGMLDTFGDLFTGREKWAEINMDELRKAMREKFILGKVFNSEGADRVQDYSYHDVGKLMKQNLEAL